MDTTFDSETKVLVAKAIWNATLDKSVELTDEERRNLWIENRAHYAQIANKTLNFLGKHGHTIAQS